MGLTKVYLISLSTLMLVYFCAGANLRLKRAESGNDSNLDANGRCITARNWKDECNNCWCVVNGTPACTLMGCAVVPTPAVITEPVAPQKESTTDADGKCVPGSKWQDECSNSCWCTDDRVSVCTKIGCSRVEQI